MEAIESDVSQMNATGSIGVESIHSSYDDSESGDDSLQIVEAAPATVAVKGPTPLGMSMQKTMLALNQYHQSTPLPYVCHFKDCGKPFASNLALRMHQRQSKHQLKADYSHECQDCHKLFFNFNCFIKHRRKIHGECASETRAKVVQLAPLPQKNDERNFSIDSPQPSKLFPTNSVASNSTADWYAKRQHTGPFHCPFANCQQSYSTQRGLNTHRAIAHQPPPRVYPGFNQISNQREAHLSTHYDKLSMCQPGGSATNRSADEMDIERQDDGEDDSLVRHEAHLAFACDYLDCGRRFQSDRSLAMHRAKVNHYVVKKLAGATTVKELQKGVLIVNTTAGGSVEKLVMRRSVPSVLAQRQPVKKVVSSHFS